MPIKNYKHKFIITDDMQEQLNIKSELYRDIVTLVTEKYGVSFMSIFDFGETIINNVEEQLQELIDDDKEIRKT